MFTTSVPTQYGANATIFRVATVVFDWVNNNFICNIQGWVDLTSYNNNITPIIIHQTVIPMSVAMTTLSSGFTEAAFDALIIAQTPIFTGATESTPQTPTISVTSPTDGSILVAGSDVTITATASEVDGTINQVSFYNGATLLGTSTSSPYSHTWSSVPEGTYTLTAVATDILNVSTTSSPVTITLSFSSY